LPTSVINRNVFSQVNQDSGSLTFATTVVHKFSDPGEYHGLLHGGGRVVGQFTISVGGRNTSDNQEEKRIATPAGLAQEEGGEMSEMQGHRGSRHDRLPMKVDIDLTNPQPSGPPDDECDCCEGDTSGAFEIEAGGYAVFHVPAGAAGRYAVEVYKAGKSGLGAKVFDSRELGESDMLAVVLLRPGTYSVTNTLTAAKAELKVTYPEKIARFAEPVKAHCTKDAITPGAIKVQPTQGLVFSFETPSRIKIELVTPEDRPRPPRSPKAGAVAAQAGETTKASLSTATTKGKKVTRTIQLRPRQSRPTQ